MTMILGDQAQADLQRALDNYGLEIRVGDFVRRDNSKTSVVVKVVDEDKLMLAASKAYVRRAIKPLI